MVLLRKTLYVILLVLPGMVWAGQSDREKEQQFKYYWYAARHAQDNEQLARAWALYEQCERINPRDAKTKEELGLLYYGIEEKEKAAKYLREAFELAPGYCWRTYYAYLSYTLPNETKDSVLTAVLERAAKANSRDPKLWEELASQYLGRGDWDRSFAAMDSMEAINGQQSRCAMTRARVYIYQKQPKKALAALDDYLKVNADEVEMLELRLQLQASLKASWQDQLETCERILLVDPDNAYALNDAAYHMSLHHQDLDRAEQLASRAVSIESYNPAYLDTYAWILYQQGKKTLARFYITQAKNYAIYFDKNMRKEIDKHYKQIYK